ncbi:MAG: hypothetical protein IJ498_05305 [Akkermansia sp.]|nr:hypothetical protein [Akkermansia sp.]
MTFYTIKRLIISPTELHIICAAAAVLSTLPILFPEVVPLQQAEQICRYAGISLSVSICVSAFLMLIATSIQIFRLSNTRAFWRFVSWLSIWGAAGLLYIFVAIMADVSPTESFRKPEPIQKTDVLHPTTDALLGPASLIIPISTENKQIKTIEGAPNLEQLEREHADIFRDYLEASPRWTDKDTNDAFYSKPGHVVMIPPSTGGIPGLVHAGFRRLVEGDPLPVGYVTIKPGDSVPEIKDSIPDIALDLGRNHYLLLAWRGAAHKETALRAINAAIADINERMQPLVSEPTPGTIQRMVGGKQSYTGSTPDLRLAEPPGQDGTYQAEVYANPGEAGTILLFIKRLDSGRTIRLLNCPAKFSSNPEEQFRHDFPGSVPVWQNSAFHNSLDNIFPPGTPLFVICKDKSHHYFGAAFEVWFNPQNPAKPRRLLLRRCYKIQGYDG